MYVEYMMQSDEKRIMMKMYAVSVMSTKEIT